MYLAGWAASAGVLAALLFIIRLLKHAGPTGSGATGAAPSAPPDYGLLRCVSMIGDLAFAREVRDRLRLNGVRATLATGHDGMVRVLVFADEFDRARRLITFELG